MSLARAWRRQLYGASTAALIVPSAMLAAVVVLALGGGFRQVGVLGQIFAGPPASSVSGVSAVAGAGSGSIARSLPVLPVAALVPRRPRAGVGHAGGGAPRERGGAVPVSARGPGQTGGALVPVDGTAPIVNGRPAAPSPPGRPAPVGSAPSQPAPAPKPQPQSQPTVVDRIVNTVTPITQQAPPPLGPAATQAVQAAGSAADSLLPPDVPVLPGVKLR